LLIRHENGLARALRRFDRLTPKSSKDSIAAARRAFLESRFPPQQPVSDAA
jgi:hypothetical protein